MTLCRFARNSLLGGLLVLLTAMASPTTACTRIVYLGANDEVITARSMDWKSDVASNLWIFPRGMARSGEGGANTPHWTSKYGSVTTSGYDICTTDGVNEAGLSAQLLWLVESQYPTDHKDKPALSLAIWAQYVLDNFATVDEATALTPNAFWVDLRKVDFSPEGKVLKLDLGKDQRNTFAGEVSARFGPSKPFHFLGVGLSDP